MDFELEGKEKKNKTMEFEGTRRSEAAEEYKKCHIKILPREMVMNILSRLSIYSLFQCTLVSKEWQGIISRDSYFATMQHNRALEKQNNIFSLLFKNEQRHLYLFERGGLKHPKLTQVVAILKFPYSHYSYFGSCNGLLCFVGLLWYPKIHVCNPVTRESACLPGLTTHFLNAKASGFGFDSATNTYKVVHISKDWPKLIAMIYTLGTEAWRQLENVPDAFGPFYYQMSDLLVNGSLHWCCHNRKPNTILSLDMSKEQFGTVPVPKLEEPVHMDVMAWKGHLSLVRFMSWNIIHIWAMKEYNVESSWTNIFNIRRPMPYIIQYVSAKTWRFDDESQLDLQTLALHLKNFSPHLSRRRVTTHIGSLVSLKTITGKVTMMEFSRYEG